MTIEWLDLHRPPALTPLFAKAALKRRGAHSELPAQGLRCAVRVDPQAMQRYRYACGFHDDGLMPPTYPHILAFPLQMHVLTRRDFPFPLLGLVHLHNQIRVVRPLGGISEVRLAVHAENLRPHPKGALFDLVISMADRLGLLWEARSSFLCRGVQVPGATAPEAPDLLLPMVEFAHWSAPADVGRRYAKVSGDYNPIHLSAPSARLFGFPGAIAHGLWLKARALAELQNQLPRANLSISATFRKPVRLPSEVILLASAAASSGQFEVRGAEQELLHLSGAWTPAHEMSPREISAD